MELTKKRLSMRWSPGLVAVLLALLALGGVGLWQWHLHSVACSRPIPPGFNVPAGEPCETQGGNRIIRTCGHPELLTPPKGFVYAC
jgi:hypothetical protein